SARRFWLRSSLRVRRLCGWCADALRMWRRFLGILWLRCRRLRCRGLMRWFIWPGRAWWDAGLRKVDGHDVELGANLHQHVLHRVDRGQNLTPYFDGESFHPRRALADREVEAHQNSRLDHDCESSDRNKNS